MLNKSRSDKFWPFDLADIVLIAGIVITKVVVLLAGS